MGLPELVTEWIKFSKIDLDVSEQLFDNMHPKPLEVICFHSQQSAEKALKAFLVLNNILPPKTHDLNQLCEMCGEISSEFDKIAIHCGSLNRYSIMPRYPFEIEIQENDAECAIRDATKVHAWILELLPSTISLWNGGDTGVASADLTNV